MPGMRGAQSLRELRRDFPTLALVVASGQDDPTTIAEVLACGVSGFIPKNEPCELILQALRLVLAGGIYVPRQALADRLGVPRHDLAGGDAGVSRAHQRTAPRLTPRQLIVLGRLLRGRSNKLIARDLALTEGTVKTHVAAILRELGASSRTEAVMRGARPRPARRAGDRLRLSAQSWKASQSTRPSARSRSSPGGCAR